MTTITTITCQHCGKPTPSALCIHCREFTTTPLFELAPTHTPVPLPTIKVTVEVTTWVDIEVPITREAVAAAIDANIDQSEAADDVFDGIAEDVHSNPEEYGIDMASVRVALASSSDKPDYEVDEVHDQLPDGWTWQRIVAETIHPTYVPIEGAA